MSGYFNKKNMEFHHFLIESGKNSTVSALYIDDEFYGYILEDEGRKDKIRGETRVDAGGPYKIKPVVSGDFYSKYKKAYSHQFAISVTGFPRHSAIMYHMLNEVEETAGCFGPALSVGRYLTGPKVGTHFIRNSKPGYLRIYEKLEPLFDPVKIAFKEEVSLFIHRETPLQIFRGEKRPETW